MSTSAREAVWVLLSDLFVDSENTERDLRAIGQALKKTGFSVGEVKLILRKEVAPVCGKWMFYQEQSVHGRYSTRKTSSKKSGSV